MEKQEKNNYREFGLTTAALDNKNTVLLLTILLAVIGILTYIGLPKESFPEVVIPKVFVKTIYPGNPPIDMENLITRPIEKEVHTIKGVKELTSTSSQDNSDIIVEFNSDVNIRRALQDVKDAVDKSKSELPNDLKFDPVVVEMDMSEFPILNVNLYGEYSLEQIKEYAEDLKDEFENIHEVSKVDFKGLQEREIILNIDQDKLSANGLSFQNIEDAINFENVSISGGDIIVGGTRRSVRTIGEFASVDEIGDIIIKHLDGNIVFLRDVLENQKVVDGFADPLTYARLNDLTVVSLSVVKKSGENLLVTTDKIMSVLSNAKEIGILPEDLNISITNDQSDRVRKSVNNLENSIIMGVIFVVGVLFFFLGMRNSLFVGFAIPMSMMISFIILGALGYTINMMILFGLVLALGMLVDNAIVVVENVHRFISQGEDLYNATKHGIGEIAWPIIASTATTLAAFVPLIFWPGMMGQFMKNLPVTLIIVLSSSLFVALIIIPVLVSTFINPEKQETSPSKKTYSIGAILVIAFIIMGYLTGMKAFANLLIIMLLLSAMNYFFLFKSSIWFQHNFLGWLENIYLKVLDWALSGWKPRFLIIGSFVLLFATIKFYQMRDIPVRLFPNNEPHFINVMVELPLGTDIDVTNEFMRKVENRISEVTKNDTSIIESILTTVGKGVVGENEMPFGNTPQKGMTTIAFIDYELRDGISTNDILKDVSHEFTDKYPGVTISVDKNKMGPPVGKQINIEITGKDFPTLMHLSDSLLGFINTQGIAGIEGLKLDIDVGKPELIVNIDREKARRFGLSTAQIASTIRTALFGKEVTDYKEGEDKYPIRLRFAKQYRNDISSLMNQVIAFRNKKGKFMQIPISAVASVYYSNTYGSVKRKDMDRVVTVYSNVLEGFNANEVNNEIKQALANFTLPPTYSFSFTGEQEEQAKVMAFIIKALLIALSLITIILVTQFNSFAKPLIIMVSVLFSTIGVFGGFATFKMEFVILMVGIGIISLAGIVVNNAIVLIDYIDLLKNKRREELGLSKGDDLPLDDTIDCIKTAGKTRLRPVLLTAITTVLGLFPMAVGMNIDFGRLLTNWNPDLYFGGENADFWGPMAWTVIFGLTFATFLTLVLVPAMYLVGNKIKLGVKQMINK
ncbi:MAG: efflux RND transporter permease subunit [Bacteroidales bacterium]|nr:efflux RND transporter permease subunit [Bacteroidales bacterium]